MQVLMLLSLTLMLRVEQHVSASHCPSVCNCKWKNGKRWVECTNKGQISLPDKIDPETQVLDLTGNNLQILPREVFSRHGLLNLQKLKLANCNIGQIDPTAFRGLTNLVELDLSGNILNSIPNPTFSDIPYLRDLALNNNPLQRVENSAFEMVPQLVSLDLSGCQIRRIHPRAFNNVKNLLKLYLHNNNINTLKQGLFESLDDLHSISLHKNPWNCDCSVRPLIDWLTQKNIPMFDQPVCETPPRLKGSRFSNIPVQDFACSPEMLSVKSISHGNIGEKGSLLCRAESVPMGTVTWYKEGVPVSNVTSTNHKVVVHHSHQGHHVSSLLVVEKLSPDDEGEYICVAENSAGSVQANFTLKAGFYEGGSELSVGEIIGIIITLILLLLVLVVIILVIIQRIRPYLLRGKKSLTVHRVEVDGGAGGAAGAAGGANQPAQQHVQVRLTDLNSATGHVGSNGGVSINGLVYSAPNGLSNGYLNPDVIPPNVNTHGTLFSGGEIESSESEESAQNRANGLASQSLEDGFLRASHGRYENFPPPLHSQGVNSQRLESDHLYPSSMYSLTTQVEVPNIGTWSPRSNPRSPLVARSPKPPRASGLLNNPQGFNGLGSSTGYNSDFFGPGYSSQEHNQGHNQGHSQVNGQGNNPGLRSQGSNPGWRGPGPVPGYSGTVPGYGGMNPVYGGLNPGYNPAHHPSNTVFRNYNNANDPTNQNLEHTNSNVYQTNAAIFENYIMQTEAARPSALRPRGVPNTSTLGPRGGPNTFYNAVFQNDLELGNSGGYTGFRDPLANRTSGEPLANRTSGEPLANRTSGDPLANRTNRHSDGFIYGTLPRGWKGSVENRVPDWLSKPTFSQDLGIPLRERNVHLNPLETLEEEEGLDNMDPTVRALDILDHTIGPGGSKLMDNSYSQESNSSGRGSSSPQGPRVLTKQSNTVVKRPWDSPDEGIQTDCGTDV